AQVRRAEHPAEVHVEGKRAGEVDVEQLRALEDQAAQVGTDHVDAAQVDAAQVEAGKIPAREVVAEAGQAQAGLEELQVRQARQAEVRDGEAPGDAVEPGGGAVEDQPGEIGIDVQPGVAEQRAEGERAVEQRAAQVGAAEVHAAQVGERQDRAAQVGAAEVDARQVEAGEIHPAQVGAAEVEAAQLLDQAVGVEVLGEVEAGQVRVLVERVQHVEARLRGTRHAVVQRLEDAEQRREIVAGEPELVEVRLDDVLQVERGEDVVDLEQLADRDAQARQLEAEHAVEVARQAVELLVQGVQHAEQRVAQRRGDTDVEGDVGPLDDEFRRAVEIEGEEVVAGDAHHRLAV